MTDLAPYVRRYITARETPGMSSERAYHAMRRALRAIEHQNTDAADASRAGESHPRRNSGHSTASVPLQVSGVVSRAAAAGDGCPAPRAPSPASPDSAATQGASAEAGNTAEHECLDWGANDLPAAAHGVNSSHRANSLPGGHDE